MNRTKLQWRDLVKLTPWQVTVELTLPAPWLCAALVCGTFELWASTVICTFAMFMTGLRLTHNAFHHTVGISKAGDDRLMFVLSVLLGGSMHAIEYTHLMHHRDCFGAKDVEGGIARLSFTRAVVQSPCYPLAIHRAALRDGSARQKIWVRRELAAAALMQAAIWFVFDSAVLQVMSLALIFANLSAAMVGIWAVHRGCEHQWFSARSCRTRWVNKLVYGMFFHLEHHLYPGVPTRNLPQLAQRLDLANQAQNVPPVVRVVL